MHFRCAVSGSWWTAAALFVVASSVEGFASVATPRLIDVSPSPRQRWSPRLRSSKSDESAPAADYFSRVAVAGATGRTGRLVVTELLSRNVAVRALVRDETKASEMLAGLPGAEKLLEIRATDLGSKDDVLNSVAGGGSGANGETLSPCDAAIWCATGFSDAPDQSIFQKISALFGFAINSQQSIDAVGLPALGDALAGTPSKRLAADDDKSGGGGALLPKVVVLSSAGVTRPGWSEEKKEALEGSAGIPIVQLNPFGILDLKTESENKLRNCGVEYCIFRPGGLNDEWPSDQRPVFSQGDVAVGRINRKDVATILVDSLTTPEATGKTFEGITVAGYPPAKSIGPALAQLELDATNGGKGPSEDAVRATYAIMQQILPGEK